MLGVTFNQLVGNFSEQIEDSKKPADTFAVRLRSPKISATDVETFHRSI